MEITWKGVTYRQGKHIPKEDLREGMVVMVDKSRCARSNCWQVSDTSLKGRSPAPFILVAHEGDAVVPGLKKLPVGMNSYHDISCHCDDLNNLYEAIAVGQDTAEVNVQTNGEPIKLTNSNQSSMSTIKTTLKNLLLSDTDKTLRAHGLEDNHGEMTNEAKTLMCEELQDERWATRRVEIATQLKAEDDKNKK